MIGFVGLDVVAEDLLTGVKVRICCGPAVLSIQTVGQQDDIVPVGGGAVFRRRCDRWIRRAQGLPSPIAAGGHGVDLILEGLPLIAHRRHRGGKAIRPLFCIELCGRASAT